MKLLRTAVLATAAAFVVLAPTAAHADTVTRYDSGGDVASIVYDEETDEATVTPTPDRKQGDITKVRTSFEGESIRISASFRGLVKAGPYMFHSLRLVTTKVQRTVDIEAGPGGWAGQVQMEKFGKPVTCKGLNHKIDYTAKVVILNVPRACLSAPGWKPGAVRVGWVTGTFNNEGTVFFDDGFRSGPIDADIPPALSAPVYR